MPGAEFPPQSLAYNELANQAVPAEAAAEPVRTDEYYLHTYGLGPAETGVPVVHTDPRSGKTYMGSLKDMLDDKLCPVGGYIQEAYASDAGFEGVKEQLGAIKVLTRGAVNIVPSESTTQYHAGTITVTELLATTKPEQPDFLEMWP